MSRKRSPLRDKAMYMYVKAAGNIKLVDIAKKLKISDAQIRQWKNKDKWDDMSVDDIEIVDGSIVIKNVIDNNNNNVTINNVTNDNITKSNENVIIKNNAVKDNGNSIKMKEVKEVVSNDELNDKEKIFCVVYSQRMNATKAYLASHVCTYNTAMVEGCKLLRKPKIKAQIDSLIASRCDKELLGRNVIQKYIDIAFSDIGDYVKFGKKYVPVWSKDEKGNDIPIIDPNTGEQKIAEYSYVDLKESERVDTSLISEVSQGKDGVKFKLADRMKALDFLNKHCNLLNDEEKIKLDIENKKLQNLKTQAEINKITGNEGPETEDDGFIAALNEKAAEVWG